MIRFSEYEKLSASEMAHIMRRAETDITELLPTAQEIINQVRARGDEAVVQYARQFDAPNFAAHLLRATPEHFAAARQALAPDVIEAIQQAHANIHAFHSEQMPEPMWFTEVAPGVMAGEKVTSVTSAGLYVPRGKGAFPSVMLMLAIPAVVAGVPRVVVVTPPTPEGTARDLSLRQPR